MTEDERGIGDMISAATELGRKRQGLEKRNARRRAKGRPPLPDEQERADSEVQRIRQRPGKGSAVVGAVVLRLCEKRMAAMMDGEDPDYGPEEDAIPAVNGGENESSVKSDGVERAQREAAAARRVSDMKNGRIDHEGVWGGGQKLEGGDDTRLPKKPEKPEKPAPATSDPGTGRIALDTGIAHGSEGVHAVLPGWFTEFRNDLYFRLKESFSGLEQTLSDLQGRISELPGQSVRNSSADTEGEAGSDEFAHLLEKRVPVVFNVGGTKMSFDAITVFHASPCITVVTKIGSATIKPRPGATLMLSYDMDGVHYEDDPVTYLGTRFELPMFGLAFIGFIRDMEASQLDVDAGREAQ